jgi:hypothetical protein
MIRKQFRAGVASRGWLKSRPTNVLLHARAALRARLAGSLRRIATWLIKTPTSDEHDEALLRRGWHQLAGSTDMLDDLRGGDFDGFRFGNSNSTGARDPRRH